MDRHIFSMLTGEKGRGALVSCVTGVTANLVNAALIAMGGPPLLTTIISLQVFGNLLTYFLDIMVAKTTFGGTPLPYTEYASRFRWFMKSLLGPPFYKFVIASTIEAIIVFAGFRRATALCDEHNIKFRHRDAVLAAAIASLSFFLLMSVLRFDWVLNESESLTLDVVVLAWMGLSALAVLLTPKAI